jgi:hypothetical protein
MLWVVCIKNSETGKWDLITPETTFDEDDPHLGQDGHIVPVREDPGDPFRLDFGVHDFVSDCPCHPKVQKLCDGRKIITHQETVN